jgi:twinkle protein
VANSTAVAREPCPDCGSRDNLTRYDDGHAYCFTPGCGRYEPGDGDTQHQPRRPVSKDLLPLGEVREIKSRGLTEKTCQRWGYTIGTFGGETVQIATYRGDDGQIIGQKVRFKNKARGFPTLGENLAEQLYGKHLCRSGGRRIIITEGEIDAMTVDQVLGYKWQVVSLPLGAGSARKALAANLEWLNTFEQVVLCFDMDEPGREAVESITSLFPPGKLAVVSLPLKDASDMLQEGRIEELVNALWGAKEHRPDGLKTVADIRDRIFENISTDLTWFDERLNKITFGRRYGECVAFGAGTGVGKTTYLMQQLAHDVMAGHNVGVFAFEQDVGETVRLVAGQIVGKTFHIPDGSWTDEELTAAVDALQEANRLHLYDHFGACEWDVVKERIRYLAHAHGVRIFLVDHLTALAAAEDNERTGLERITAEISSLAQELSIWIGVVSHLATPEGKPHEEGGRVMIRHFKGSRAIGFWMHEIYGLERNQQADDENEKRQTIIRILKHRKVGRTVGSTFPIRYEDTTGRLVPADDALDDMTADESEEAF